MRCVKLLVALVLIAASCYLVGRARRAAAPISPVRVKPLPLCSLTQEALLVCDFDRGWLSIYELPCPAALLASASLASLGWSDPPARRFPRTLAAGLRLRYHWPLPRLSRATLLVFPDGHVEAANGVWCWRSSTGVMLEYRDGQRPLMGVDPRPVTQEEL